MGENISLQRGWKSFGFAGPVGFLLVFWAAAKGAAFDWGVFGLAFAALCLCWARTWVLVPIHERLSARDRMEWDRFVQNDWNLMEVFTDMSGEQIDKLRAMVNAADNAAVDAALQANTPHWDADERHRFLDYFIRFFFDGCTAYLDQNGKLQRYDT